MGDANLTFTNEGDVVSTGGFLAINTGTNVITNNDIMETSGSGSSVLDIQSPIQNSGTVQSNPDGQINFDAAGSINEFGIIALGGSITFSVP